MDWILYDNSLRHERVKVCMTFLWTLGVNGLVLLANLLWQIGKKKTINAADQMSHFWHSIW